MPAVSFSDAAAAVGHSSRSTLYRLRDEGRLDEYLRPGGRGGASLLELTPPGLPTLRQHLQRVLRPQASAATGKKAAARRRVDRRWNVVAGSLSEALESVGGLTLTAEEAAAIAAALPAAVCEAFGWAGAEQLRQALAEGVATLPAAGGEPLPVAEVAGSDPLAFFRDYGRIDPAAEPLEGPAYWQEVAAWVNALQGRGPAADPRPDGGEPPEPLAWVALADIAGQVDDVGPAVDAGVRFDLGRWDAATLRDFLLPDAADGCATAAAELELRMAAGRVPAELVPEVVAVLEAFKPAAAAA